MGGEAELAEVFVTQASVESKAFPDALEDDLNMSEQIALRPEELEKIEKEAVFAEYADIPMSFKTNDGTKQTAMGSYQAYELCGYLKNDRLNAAFFRRQFAKAAAYYLEPEVIEDENASLLEDTDKDKPEGELSNENRMETNKNTTFTNNSEKNTTPNQITTRDKVVDSDLKTSNSNFKNGDSATPDYQKDKTSPVDFSTKDQSRSDVSERQRDDTSSRLTLEQIRQEVALAHEALSVAPSETITIARPDLVAAKEEARTEDQASEIPPDTVSLPEEFVTQEGVSLNDIRDLLPYYDKDTEVKAMTEPTDEKIENLHPETVNKKRPNQLTNATENDEYDDKDVMYESIQLSDDIPEDSTAELELADDNVYDIPKLTETFNESSVERNSSEVLLDELLESLEEQIVHLEQSYVIEENLGIIDAVSVGSEETIVSLEMHKTAEKQQLKNIIDLIQCLNAQIEIESTTSLLSYEAMPDLIKKQLIELLKMIGYEHADLILQNYIDYYGIERLIHILQYLASISYGNGPRPFMTPVTTPFLRLKPVQLFRSLARYAIQPIVSRRYQANA